MKSLILGNGKVVYDFVSIFGWVFLWNNYKMRFYGFMAVFLGNELGFLLGNLRESFRVFV